MKIELNVNGRDLALETPPLRRLLDLLREDLGLTGAKEGCGEGECGACAVLLDGLLVNSCLVPALQVHGRRVVTIEGLGTREHPDPVQSAFLEEGAVQCGFCIPGMVMASRSLLDRNPAPDRMEIRTALAGNLCRCTGYERILRAVERAAGVGLPGTADTAGSGRAHPGSSSPRGMPSLAAPPDPLEEVFSPSDLGEALRVLQERGHELTIVAGATDLLTNIRLGLVQPWLLLDTSRIEELQGTGIQDAAVAIGAGTTLASLASDPLIASHLPALAQAASLFGAPAIQNRATVGGNLMSASPAADLPPVLLALEARVLLAGAGGSREVPVTSFYAGYRQTVRRPDELLVKVLVPVQAEGEKQAFYKVGTRRAQSIAKISVAGKARLGSDRVVASIRLAAGSVAPVPLSLVEAARFLQGRELTPRVAQEAGRIAAQEVEPIDDVRSSVQYRRTVTGNLVSRFLQDLLSA